MRQLVTRCNISYINTVPSPPPLPRLTVKIYFFIWQPVPSPLPYSTPHACVSVLLPGNLYLIRFFRVFVAFRVRHNVHSGTESRSVLPSTYSSQFLSSATHCAGRRGGSRLSTRPSTRETSGSTRKKVPTVVAKLRRINPQSKSISSQKEPETTPTPMAEPEPID